MRSDKKKTITVKPVSHDGKAALFTLGFAYVYLLVEIIYKFKRERVVCTWELVLLFLLFAVFGFLKKLFSETAVPCSFDGTPLPAGDSQEDKAIRNQHYKKSALLYALVFSTVTLLATSVSSNIHSVNLGIELFFDTEVPNFILAFIVSAILFGVVYLLAYMIDYLWYEERLSALQNQEEQTLDELMSHEISLTDAVPDATDGTPFVTENAGIEEPATAVDPMVKDGSMLEVEPPVPTQPPRRTRKTPAKNAAENGSVAKTVSKKKTASAKEKDGEALEKKPTAQRKKAQSKSEDASAKEKDGEALKKKPTAQRKKAQSKSENTTSKVP